MKRRQQDFALGLTAIIFVGLVVGTILFLYPLFRGGGRVVEIEFRHEEGMAPLKAGSAVLLGGSLEVGRVLEVRIEQKGLREHTVFVVVAEIRDDVPLYDDCQITTGEPAIGGSGYVLILNVGTPGVPLEQPIKGRPPQSLAAAIGTLSQRLLADGGLLDQLNKAVDPEAEGSVLHKMLVSLQHVNEMTYELREQMRPDERKTLLGKIHLLLGHLNETTEALKKEMVAGDDAAMLAKVHRALDHLDQGLSEAAAMLKEDRPLVLETLTRIEHAARTVDQEMLVVLQAELDPANPESTLGKLHVAMDRVNASLNNVKAMTGAGERMVALSRPVLDKTLANFQGVSEQLRLASQEILLNPSKLIWGPKRQREKQLLVFQAARSFAEAAGQLDDAAGRLEAVLQVLPEDEHRREAVEEEIRSIHDAVRAAFQRFERAEQALWEQLK